MKAKTFKLNVLDKLERAKSKLVLDITSEDEPYYKIKKSSQLTGLQDAIEIIQELTTTDLKAIQKKVIKATFSELLGTKSQ